MCALFVSTGKFYSDSWAASFVKHEQQATATFSNFILEPPPPICLYRRRMGREEDCQTVMRASVCDNRYTEKTRFFTRHRTEQHSPFLFRESQQPLCFVLDISIQISLASLRLMAFHRRKKGDEKTKKKPKGKGDTTAQPSSSHLFREANSKPPEKYLVAEKFFETFY